MSNYTIFIDETKSNDNSQGFCAIAIEENFLDKYRAEIEQKRMDLLDDPLYDYPFTGKMNQQALAKSFHMTENHPDTREKIWEVIRYFSYEAFIFVYHNVSDENKIRNIFLNYLYRFLKQRYKTSNVSFIWETDTSQSFSYPAKIPIQEKSKVEEPLLSIADHVLFVFWRGYKQDYTSNNEYQKTSDKKFYEMFKEKLRFTKIDTIRKPYTHKNPLELWKTISAVEKEDCKK